MQLQDHYTTRDINNQFKFNLCYETSDCIINNNPFVHTSFNSYLNKYLRIFHDHFPQRKFIKRHQALGYPGNVKDSSI